VSLKDQKQVNSYITSLQKKLGSQQGKAAVTITNQNIAGDDSTINIMLSGSNAGTLDKAASTVRSNLAGIEGSSH